MKSSLTTLARAFAAHRGVALNVSQRDLRLLFWLLAERLSKDRVLKVPGFGRFEVRTRKARRIRHPRREELMQLPATEEIRFYASRELVERVTGRRPS